MLDLMVSLSKSPEKPGVLCEGRCLCCSLPPEHVGFLKGVFKPSIREGRPKSCGVKTPCNLWGLAGVFGCWAWWEGCWRELGLNKGHSFPGHRPVLILHHQRNLLHSQPGKRTVPAGVQHPSPAQGDRGVLGRRHLSHCQWLCPGSFLLPLDDINVRFH